jgi:hypothetical protein
MASASCIASVFEAARNQFFLHGSELCCVSPGYGYLETSFERRRANHLPIFPEPPMIAIFSANLLGLIVLNTCMPRCHSGGALNSLAP